ncbi:uncharacterized protein LOC141652439 [Silene latifolia]|uniref:uncharacterized protein LOC141652439 n=1 Tax=Silene latifolia TaxID=37657 RepID=UPI003D775A66
MASGEEDLLIDLESGAGGAGDGVTAIALNEEGCRAGRKTWSSALSCNGIMTSLSDTDSSVDVSNLSNIAFGGLELAIDKLSGGEETREVVAVVPIEKKNPGESRKKPNGKKSSKPPRPPKGPVLTAYDLKLVKELTELAARKRARIERIKALRKMKESKRSTSSSSMPAMIMTALFFFVLIFQGTFCGNNARKQVVESPAPATLREGLVPFQVLNNAPTNEMNQPSSLSFSTSEQPLSSSHHRKEGVDAR